MLLFVYVFLSFGDATITDLPSVSLFFFVLKKRNQRKPFVNIAFMALMSMPDLDPVLVASILLMAAFRLST